MKTIEISAEAFRGYGIERISLTADENCQPMVYDSVAGHYSHIHSLDFGRYPSLRDVVHPDIAQRVEMTNCPCLTWVVLGLLGRDALDSWVPLDLCSDDATIAHMKGIIDRVLDDADTCGRFAQQAYAQIKAAIQQDADHCGSNHYSLASSIMRGRVHNGQRISSTYLITAEVHGHAEWVAAIRDLVEYCLTRALNEWYEI